jgi:short-subunit dehydrogenase
MNHKGYDVSPLHLGDYQPDPIIRHYQAEAARLAEPQYGHEDRPSKGPLVSMLALVTGASSGIGKAFAERLAADGYDLVVVGRRKDRLDELAASLTNVTVECLAADLSTDEGVDAVAEVCDTRPLTMLVNNAGVAHYMPFSELPADKARELVHVKVVAPTMLARAAVPGMVERGEGTIINVAGMIAFSGPAGPEQMPRRAVYTGTLAHSIAWTQQLHAELASEGISVQVVCPGVVATEFHERQGLDLSAVPRMSAQDVVTASLRGIDLGEVVCAPGIEDSALLETVFRSDLAAFEGQSPELAKRYRV